MKTKRGKAEYVKWIDATEFSSWAEAQGDCAVAETLGWVRATRHYLHITMTAYEEPGTPSEQDGPVLVIPRKWVVCRKPI